MFRCMKTIHQILALWPDRQAIADAIGRTKRYADNLCRPGRTPTSRHDLALWRDAQERGLPLTLDEFVEAREVVDSVGKLPKQEAAE